MKDVIYIVEAPGMTSIWIPKPVEKHQFQDIKKSKILYVHLSETNLASRKNNTFYPLSPLS